MNTTTYPDDIEPDTAEPAAATFPDDIEPDAPAPAVVEDQATPVGQTLMEILGDDIPLPTLIKFIPNRALRDAADASATRALLIDVTTPDGLTKADAELSSLGDSLKAIELHFKEPADILYRAHRKVTTERGEWLKPGQDAHATVSGRIVKENRRREQEEADRRRHEQEEADRKAKEDAKREAEEARRHEAPAHVIEELQQKAETATAAPVARASFGGSRLAGSSIVKSYKCRIKGTPGDAEPNPKMSEITPAQAVHVRALMQDIIDNKAPLTAFEFNWSVLNGRAKADKNTFEMAGLEAFEDAGLRSKGRR